MTISLNDGVNKYKQIWQIWLRWANGKRNEWDGPWFEGNVWDGLYSEESKMKCDRWSW